jgi:hypothetical protein
MSVLLIMLPTYRSDVTVAALSGHEAVLWIMLAHAAMTSGVGVIEIGGGGEGSTVGGG